MEPAVLVVESSRLVDGREHREAFTLPQLEVFPTAARCDVDDAGALVERDLVPGNDTVLDGRPRLQRVERSLVTPADELGTGQRLLEGLVRVPRDRDPFAVRAAAVLRLRVHGGCDVRRQRPRRRRPDHERLALPIEQRQAHVERRVGAILVDARLRELVLRERCPAARAPLGRAMAHVEPALVVHLLEHPPDVLDVRVAERVVVVPPVHPHAEPLRATGELPRVPDDGVAALRGELVEPVRLDLLLRVEAELVLDADLDPQALAVEPVLIALIEPAEALVALEDVLQGAAPGRMDGEGLVGRDRAVEERENWPTAVTLAKPLEDTLGLPPGQNLLFERRVIGHRREGVEDLLGHREAKCIERRSHLRGIGYRSPWSRKGSTWQLT